MTLNWFVNYSQKTEMRITCDTTWELNGKLYNAKPQDTSFSKSTHDLSPKLWENDPFFFRKLVDSLKYATNFSINKDSIAALVLKHDPIFNSSWCNSCLFESSGPLLSTSKELIVRMNNEECFYNQWGSLTYGYGPRWGRMHRGLDLPLTPGDTVHSSFNGIVRYAEFNTGGYGNCVVVRNFNGIETLHAHLSKILVTPGELVHSGDFLGLGGTTGRSSGPHLHFETRYKGKSFDPLKVFNKQTFNIKSDTLILSPKSLKDPKIPRQYHVVKSGETLSKIARKHKTSVKKIQRLNGIKNPNEISVGKRIKVK